MLWQVTPTQQLKVLIYKFDLHLYKFDTVIDFTSPILVACSCHMHDMIMQTHTPYLVDGATVWGGVGEATVQEVHTATELTDTTHTAYIRTKLEIITCTSHETDGFI